MAIDLTKLTADVTALEATAAKNNDLLVALSAEIKALSGSTTDPATQAALDALAGRIEAAAASVATADASNPAS